MVCRWLAQGSVQSCECTDSYNKRSHLEWQVKNLCMLMQAVQQFALSPTAVAAHIAALAQLTASRAAAAMAEATSVSQGLPDTAAWGSIVLQAAENELGRYVEQVGS